MRAMLFVAALASALLLSGCGIKGPLYHPDPAKSRPAAGADHNKPTTSPTQ